MAKGSGDPTTNQFARTVDEGLASLASFFLVLFACSVNNEVVVFVVLFLVLLSDYENMVSLQFQSLLFKFMLVQRYFLFLLHRDRPRRSLLCTVRATES